MAQLAVGGSWHTTIVLVNSGATPAQAWFDSTSGFVVGVALANISQQPANVAVTTRDEGGLVIGTGMVTLLAQEHTSTSRQISVLR